jgi:hypothetical protein
MADDEHYGAAVDAVAAREYDAAGERYARSAWATLADPRPDQGPFDGDEKGWVGKGVVRFVTAAVAHRVAASPERATHRGVEGAAVARDLRAALDHPAQRACLAEIVADCRAAAGMDGVDAAYEDAADAYREAAGDVDDPQTWATTPLFQAAAAPLKQVARGPADGEIAVTWEALHGDDPAEAGAFLAHRATYKRQRFPAAVGRVVDDGVLAAPRGTTAYGTDHHRCPACGSTDVNWVADATLCLRCSHPMDQR